MTIKVTRMPNGARFPGVKKGNEYAAAIGDLYNAAPKAVLAAIAVSFCSCGGDRIEEAEQAVLGEWWALYNAGIVEQKPPRATDMTSADVVG